MLKSGQSKVTVLCGFLGAGKTTLLNHLLVQAEGKKWAAVVNDVASINIDGALVRVGQGSGDDDVIELGNGCVCCSSRDELAETVARLAAENVYEHILIETTGVAEPRGVANLFVQKNPFGRSLGDFATLSALVSVIDAAAFLREWQEQQKQRSTPVKVTPGQRPVFELMVEQVECADLLVFNKCDLVSASEIVELESIVRGLNGRAEIVQAERGQVASEFLLGRVRFDAKETLGAARWVQVLNAAATTPGGPTDQRVVGKFVAKPGGGFAQGSVVARHQEQFGITSFVYQARRPFVAGKFYAFLDESVPGLLRAKGFYWVQEQPDEMGFVSVAGGVVRREFLNYWLAAMVENGKVRRSELPDVAEKIWAEPHGDRRQELVFIGVNLDESSVRARLDACLAG